MREMKDSGVEWIGEIPNDWELAPLRNFVTLHQHTGFKSDDPQLQFKAGHIIEKPHNGQYVKDDLSEYNHLEPNDIVINPLNLNYDFNSLRVAKADFPGYITNAYVVIHPNQQVINPTFLSYMLKSFDSEKVFHNMGRGVRKTLNFNELKAMRLPIPMQAIQTEIADYLDSKCSQIDFIVEKTQQEIEKLKEYRQSMITEAVTKGLDPDVDMKDSDIEWIREIPKDWHAIPLKRLFRFGKGLGITKADLQERGIPVISYGQVHSKTNSGTMITSDLIRYVSPDKCSNADFARTKTGDFIVADTSEDLDGCGNAVYIDSDCGVYAGYHTIILHSESQSDNRYYGYLFKTDAYRSQIRSKASGVKVLSITQSLLRDVSVIAPPKAVQKSIADYLDSKCSQIDFIVEKIRQEIDKLQEYKKSLIYECVTGKKEVASNARSV